MAPPYPSALSSFFSLSLFGRHVLDKSLPCDTFWQKLAMLNERSSFLTELLSEWARSDGERGITRVTSAVKGGTQDAAVGAGLARRFGDVTPWETEFAEPEARAAGGEVRAGAVRAEALTSQGLARGVEGSPVRLRGGDQGVTGWGLITHPEGFDLAMGSHQGKRHEE